MNDLKIDIQTIIPANGVQAYFQNGRCRHCKTVAVWALGPGSKIYGIIPGRGGLSVAELHPDFQGYNSLTDK